MRVTMDFAGRLVIPKEIRREADLRPGEPLEIQCREGKIELEPAPLAVRIEQRGKLAVAVPDSPVGLLTRGTVEATRKSLRARSVRRPKG